MIRHFSIPTLLRMTPNALIREYLQRCGMECHCLDWSKLGERQIEPLMHCLSWAPREQRDTMESLAAVIFDLATETGWQAIVDAARNRAISSFLESAPLDRNPYARAMWAWLHHPAVFDEASLMHQVGQLTYWRKRTGLPSITPRVTPETLQALSTALSTCLCREEGRGKRCTVEYFRRGDGADIFVASPDDFVETVMAHDDHGTLIPRSIQKTFEIVFAYHAEEGTLELNAEVPSRLKSMLENIFGQIILGCDLAEHTVRRPFDLNRLKDRYFCLDTDPSDHVRACICRLRFVVPEYGRVTLEPPEGCSTAQLLEQMDEVLNENVLCWDELEIQQATIRFLFEAQPRRRAGVLTFDVSQPDRCCIRSRNPERAALTRKYLRQWRIACA